MYKKSIFRHRRDLRIHDNAGLYKALKNSENVQPIFIFDVNILDRLPRDDQRVRFIHQELHALKQQYRAFGADLMVLHGDPKTILPQLVDEWEMDAVFTNRDYEPYALERDAFIFKSLETRKIAFQGAKDHVIFEKNEVVKDDGKPYSIYTPYARKWKSLLNEFYLRAYPVEKYLSNLRAVDVPSTMISLEEMGFQFSEHHAIPDRSIPAKIIEQ